MANPGRIFAAALFFLILGPGWCVPGAAEPLFLVPEGTDLALPEAAHAAAVPARDALGAPLGEPDVTGEGSVAGQDPLGLVGIDDGWADAHAGGSRISHAAVVASAYDVALNSQVRHFLDLFTGSRRDVVTLWVNRSSRYLAMIRETLRARGMPEELAFTAMIESGFKPDAVSRMGAKGMWQFMAATARRYGLRVDRWVDERLDPEKSTAAAAAYLRDLHTMFGSWQLAQAAYNAGEVKVLRAIRLTGSRDFWTLAQSRHLKRETKDFVPQIHAATMIGREPARYGFEFDDVAPVAVETVSVPASTELSRLAGQAGLSSDEIRALNPTLLKGVTPPGAAWTLRVPSGARESIVAALQPRRAPVVVAAVRGGEVSRAAATGEIHVVRPRDTVSGIAKRYGVSVGDVMRWNSLDSQDRIRPGDRLRVAGVRSAADR
jgi:membrane-bound lytic murein transglycosylase D